MIRASRPYRSRGERPLAIYELGYSLDKFETPDKEIAKLLLARRGGRQSRSVWKKIFLDRFLNWLDIASTSEQVEKKIQRNVFLR